jgi:hypothetical protein
MKSETSEQSYSAFLLKNPIQDQCDTGILYIVLVVAVARLSPKSAMHAAQPHAILKTKVVL